jgi:hypothetical protein
MCFGARHAFHFDAVKIEHALQPNDLALLLRQMPLKILFEAGIRRLLDHRRKRFNDLISRIVNVAQCAHEQVAERLYVF